MTQKYRIARILNSHGDLDYFHGDDERYFASFTCAARAWIFTDETDVENQLAYLRRNLSTFVDGSPIVYKVEPA